ncbi:phage baseplate assembly protein [Neisseria shayeganii]|uniref:Phage tail protein n=1 Tax=Neisseria shayeganii TaxID=607712 RepID=A0A7D7RUC0_9NEIS|nr:phage tail protein [Neisseria shayeganii]QMT40004.1 phage tail protein [Neisseria shayeganii]
MPTPDNTVSLLINGQTHGQWTDYDIDSDLLTPADDFAVTLGRPVDAKPDAVQPGDKVQVRVGSDTVLSGRIDRVETRTEKGGKTLTITGRDEAAVLLDCSCPIFDAQDMDLPQIIDKIVKPLGLTQIRIDAARTQRTHKVQIEPGSRAWDALVQYAEANGLWPWVEPDGTLVVGGPDYTAPPVADLILRLDGRGNNIEQLEVERDLSPRYSEVTVLGQSHSGRHNIRATAKDEGFKLHRPLIVVEADVDDKAEAERKAKKRLADGRLEALTITATVKGHRNDDGVLWQPGQRIRVMSEPDGLDAIYFLMARKFAGGRGQPTHTVLTLKEDGAWVLDADPPKRQGQQGNGNRRRRSGRRRNGGSAEKQLQILD